MSQISKKAVFDLKGSYVIILIFIVGALLRLVLLGDAPGNGNLNQDEAFAAYEAYSISEYGIDSHGYHNPVYLETWGSGMNALETYLLIPFVKLFGLNSISIRLPQALLGYITLWIVYLLFTEVAGKNVAVWGTLVLAVSPWHIMMSRWGLESNVIVGMLTIAVYFLLTARHKMGRIIAASIFMGLSLYCYSAVWIIYPFLLIGIFIYLLVSKQITLKESIVYVAILFVMALPLLLFLAVNMGSMEEINSFISIPKLGYFRKNEVEFSLEKLKYNLDILWNQNDGLKWNSIEEFGLFYHFIKIFIPIGIWGIIAKKNKKSIPILIWLLVSLGQSAFVYGNFNRLNALFIPIVFVIASGISFFVSIIKDNYRKIICGAVVAWYCVNLFLFAKYYFGEYDNVMSNVWFDGLEEALDQAVSMGGSIHIQDGDAHYPLVLFYTEYPTDKFVESVEYQNPSAIYLHPAHFEGFYMTDFTGEEAVPGDVYICSKNNTNALIYMYSNGMTCKQFGNYMVGK